MPRIPGVWQVPARITRSISTDQGTSQAYPEAATGPENG